MTCYVRLMHKGDVAQVTEIDREAFPALWPPIDYKRELGNRLAHYIVACSEREMVEESEEEAFLEKDSPGLGSMIRRLFSYKPSESVNQYITGFAGFWIMAEEAHLASIAVRELHRHHGIGELLLISMITLAIELNTRIITLEVRVSNTIAQRLYYKYGFIQTGLRHHYYIDNKEDAVAMSIENITSAPFQAHLQRLKQAHFKK